MSGWFLNHRRATILGGLVLVALVAVRGQSGAGERRPAPAVRMIQPENLSAANRAELHARMSRHGSVLSNLVKAVVLLDRPTIAVLAGRIADEEVVARTEADGSKKWEARLPKGFFVEQDALRAAARDLAASAVDGASDDTTADRFASVAHTCVACHSVYLRGRAAGE